MKYFILSGILKPTLLDFSTNLVVFFSPSESDEDDELLELLELLEDDDDLLVLVFLSFLPAGPFGSSMAL